MDPANFELVFPSIFFTTHHGTEGFASSSSSLSPSPFQTHKTSIFTPQIPPSTP